MSEMTKREKKVTQENVEKETNEHKDSVARDRREKKYYYDDAHGYEIYSPEMNEEEDENK